MAFQNEHTPPPSKIDPAVQKKNGEAFPSNSDTVGNALSYQDPHSTFFVKLDERDW